MSDDSRTGFPREGVELTLLFVVSDVEKIPRPSLYYLPFGNVSDIHFFLMVPVVALHEFFFTVKE